MFVLGIDPGLSRCGYGLVARKGQGFTALAAGVITTDPHASLPDRLGSLQREISSLLEELNPDVVAVERVFFQTNVKTAMGVGQASGIALASASIAGCEVAEYTSNEVKEAMVGYGAATKNQVQAMVAKLSGLAGPPSPPDVADALGLALCHLTREPLRRAVLAVQDHRALARSDRSGRSS
ncbi:MAG: crossover junction endodeoxyribonuclease RuvC [Actinobacteria bacterium]|nr:crossover junction endodeoxyribonuclease RuvC [Actinomycetota bacterium]